GGAVKDAVGNSASSLTFAAPATSAVRVDTAAPSAALTYSASAVKSGGALTITATFSEPMADSPVTTIAITAATGGTALAATPMAKVASTPYTYLFTVQACNGTASLTATLRTE